MHCPLVDFHCHLDLYRDYETIFKDCRRNPVEILAVTTTPRAWTKNMELADGAPNVRVALGFHPQLVTREADALVLFRRLLPRVRYIGEVGLDASPQYYKSFSEQKRVFEGVLRACCEQGDKILSLHSVRCAGEVLKMLEAFLPQDRGIAVLHWFTGTTSEARRAAQLGCYFSINLEMLKSEQKRSLIATLPRERLLTETDGPFTMIEGRPSLPRDVASTLKALATVLKTEIEVVKSMISLNLQRLEGEKLS